MIIDVENQGVTNSSACKTAEGFDSKKLLDRYSVEKRILELCNYKDLSNDDLLRSFNNIVNDLYTTIKCSRHGNFNEVMWEDW